MSRKRQDRKELGNWNAVEMNEMRSMILRTFGHSYILMLEERLVTADAALLGKRRRSRKMFISAKPKQVFSSPTGAFSDTQE